MIKILLKRHWTLPSQHQELFSKLAFASGAYINFDMAKVMMVIKMIMAKVMIVIMLEIGEPWWPQLDLTLARDFATYTALHSNSQVKMSIAMLILCRSSLTMVIKIQSLSVKEGERLWILDFRRMSNILKFQGLNGSQPLASLSAKVGKQGGTPPPVVWFLCAMVMKYENKGGGLLVEWCANYTRTWAIFWNILRTYLGHGMVRKFFSVRNVIVDIYKPHSCLTL